MASLFNNMNKEKKMTLFKNSVEGLFTDVRNLSKLLLINLDDIDSNVLTEERREKLEVIFRKLLLLNRQRKYKYFRHIIEYSDRELIDDIDYDSMDTIGEFEFGGLESEPEPNEHSNQSNEQERTGNEERIENGEEEEPDIDYDENNVDNTVSVGSETINLSQASPQEVSDFINNIRTNRLIRGDLDSFYRPKEPSVKLLTEEEKRMKEERIEQNTYNMIFGKTQPEFIDLVSDTENLVIEIDPENRPVSITTETRSVKWTPTQKSMEEERGEELRDELKRTGETRKELPAKNKYVDKPISIDLSSSGEEEPIVPRNNGDDPLKDPTLVNEIKELLERVNTPERKEEEVGKETNVETHEEEEVSEMVLYDESDEMEEDNHDEPLEKPQFEEHEKVYEDTLQANNHENMINMEPELPFMRKDREIVLINGLRILRDKKTGEEKRIYINPDIRVKESGTMKVIIQSEMRNIGIEFDYDLVFTTIPDLVMYMNIYFKDTQIRLIMEYNYITINKTEIETQLTKIFNDKQIEKSCKSIDFQKFMDNLGVDATQKRDTTVKYLIIDLNELFKK